MGIETQKKYLIEKGYNEVMIGELYSNSYHLECSNVKTMNKKLSIINFIENFKLINFSIRHIMFENEIYLKNNFIRIGTFDGGYMCLNLSNNNITIQYADDLEYGSDVFTETQSEFFEVLLIIAEYSRNISEGKISAFDKDEKENYNLKCLEICPVGNYDFFL